MEFRRVLFRSRKELYATIQENQSAARVAVSSDAVRGLLEKLK